MLSDLIYLLEFAVQGVIVWFQFFPLAGVVLLAGGNCSLDSALSENHPQRTALLYAGHPRNPSWLRPCCHIWVQDREKPPPPRAPARPCWRFHTMRASSGDNMREAVRPGRIKTKPPIPRQASVLFPVRVCTISQDRRQATLQNKTPVPARGGVSVPRPWSAHVTVEGAQAPQKIFLSQLAASWPSLSNLGGVRRGERGCGKHCGKPCFPLVFSTFTLERRSLRC